MYVIPFPNNKYPPSPLKNLNIFFNTVFRNLKLYSSEYHNHLHIYYQCYSIVSVNSKSAIFCVVKLLFLVGVHLGVKSFKGVGNASVRNDICDICISMYMNFLRMTKYQSSQLLKLD